MLEYEIQPAIIRSNLPHKCNVITHKHSCEQSLRGTNESRLKPVGWRLNVCVVVVFFILLINPF